MSTEAKYSLAGIPQPLSKYELDRLNEICCWTFKHTAIWTLQEIYNLSEEEAETAYDNIMRKGYSQ